MSYPKMMWSKLSVYLWLLALLLAALGPLVTQAVTYVVQEPFPSAKPLDKHEKW